MPTRRLPDEAVLWPTRPPCRHPEHNPPEHAVFEPGAYEHECPECGQLTTFRVDGAVW